MWQVSWNLAAVHWHSPQRKVLPQDWKSETNIIIQLKVLYSQPWQCSKFKTVKCLLIPRQYSRVCAQFEKIVEKNMNSPMTYQTCSLCIYMYNKLESSFQSVAQHWNSIGFYFIIVDYFNLWKQDTYSKYSSCISCVIKVFIMIVSKP